MTETIPQPRVAEEGGLGRCPRRRAGAARLRPAPVRGQRGPPRPHPVEQPRPAHRHGRHPIEEVGRPEPARSVRGDGCDGHRGRPGGRPQPGRPGRRHRGDRRRDHRRAPRRRPARGRTAAGRPERPRRAHRPSQKDRQLLRTDPAGCRRLPGRRHGVGRHRGRRQGPQASTRPGHARPQASGDRAASATPSDAARRAWSAARFAQPGRRGGARGRLGRTSAIIRAVSDGGFGPGMVTGGMAALRSLRAAAPVAERWAAACRERTVLLAGPRSFCAGRGAGDRDRRARPRAARRAGLRAQADRAQHPGRVRPRAARRDLRRRARRGAQRRHRRVLRPRGRARGPLRRLRAVPVGHRRDLPAGVEGARRGAPVRREGVHGRADRARRPRGGRGHARRGAGLDGAGADRRRRGRAARSRTRPRSPT